MWPSIAIATPRVEAIIDLLAQYKKNMLEAERVFPVLGEAWRKHIVKLCESNVEHEIVDWLIEHIPASLLIEAAEHVKATSDDYLEIEA